MYDRVLTAGVVAIAVAGSSAFMGVLPTYASPGAQQVTVSCYRGPTNSVIWDKPNGVFVESLIAIGMTAEEALAIGTVVCRDERIIDNHAAMAERTLALIAEARRGNR